MKKNMLFLMLVMPVICMAQEKVFFNATIFTADPQKPFADAIAIDGKKISAIGNYDDVKVKADAKAVWIDMKGAFIMPGFVDSHNHGINGGKGLTKANVVDKILTIDELRGYALQEWEKKEGMTGDVLVIYGINISTWKELDKINQLFNSGEFTSKPLVLKGSDGHTAWCNKSMMEKAGLTRSYLESLKPEDRIFFGVTSSGEPNGFVSEDGIVKITSALKVENDFSKAAEKTMIYNNQFGITAFLDPSAASLDNSYRNSLSWYKYLIGKEKLTAHVAATIVVDVDKGPQEMIDTVKALQKIFNDRNFSIIGFKVFADGVIEHPTHTAAVSIPYTGTTSKGVLMFDPKKFSRFATMADKQNLLVHVHAIGDLAVTETLNGFEEVRKANKNFVIPHTITHLQIVQPTDFKRFAKLNVLASFQLLWAFGDVTTIDIVKPYLDPSLYKWQYPARSLLQSGATICGASDWPVSTANPFEAIYNAETRRGPMGVLDSTQCMPRMAMLYAYTIEAAKAMRMEKSIGSLEVGKYADIIMLDRDILTVSPEAMKNTRVLWTMFEGEKVYEALK